MNVEGPATWIDRADHAVTVGQTLRTPDAALIVAMRNALPALLSQLRGQRERADYWQRLHAVLNESSDRLGPELMEANLRTLAAERTVREQREALERIREYCGDRVGYQYIVAIIADLDTKNTEGEGT